MKTLCLDCGITIPDGEVHDCTPVPDWWLRFESEELSQSNGLDGI